MSRDVSDPQLSKSHDGTHEPTEDCSSSHKFTFSTSNGIYNNSECCEFMGLALFLVETSRNGLPEA